MHGIKLMVFENLLGFIGISAILSFVFTKFRDLPYDALRDLVIEIGKSEWLDIAREKSHWYADCVRLYKGRGIQTFIHMS